MSKEIDPEALAEYRTIIRTQLDHLESIIPALENGEPLGRLPAFGQMEGSQTATDNYTQFYETTWKNLQDLREALYGMISTLNDSADLAEETDEEAATDMEAYDSLLTAPSETEQTTNPGNAEAQ